MDKRETFQSSEDYFEAMLSEVIKENLDSVPEVHITVEELIELERQDRIKRRKRMIKYVSTVAAVVIVCITTLFIVWPSDMVPAVADKDRETTMVENGSTVIINSDEENPNREPITIQEEDWNKVEKLKDKVNGLCIPEYVPEGFKFKKVVLEIDTENCFAAKYYLENDNGTVLAINQYRTKNVANHMIYINDKAKYIETSKGRAVQYTNEEAKSKAIIIIANNRIAISVENSNLKEEEYREIIESIKFN